jgi:segregation and condensation protein B
MGQPLARTDDAGRSPTLVLLPPGDRALAELCHQLVAVLFAAAGPVPMGDLARSLEVDPDRVQGAVAALRASPPVGLALVQHGAELSLASAPTAAAAVERYLGAPAPTRLSRAALEVLAIVAYEQPTTRAEVEAVRGVNSDSAVATLLARGLIAEVGRRETVGRPALLATTDECLRYLGLSALSDLPPLPAREAG